jgi:DNA-binding beta-propeller fold protein YncE
MKSTLVFFLTLIALLLTNASLFAADPLSPRPPAELTGTKGKFDFIKVDSTRHRLLACHTGNGSLDVIDVDSSKLIKSIPTGAAQGVAVDDKNGLYYVSVSKPPKLVIIDAIKLEVVGEVPLPDPADVLTFHPGSNRVFVCDDDKPQLWIIDPVAKTILTTLTLPGTGMEDLGFDSKGIFLFQCLKDSNELARIDPASQKVVANWPTAPSEKPHGLAILDTNAVLVAGGTGKLSLINQASGQVTASTDIAPRVDEIAYDPVLKRVYCASGTGVITVVSVDQDKLTTLATIPSAPGAHSIAVDPETHTVWIVFAKNDQPFVQAFSAR